MIYLALVYHLRIFSICEITNIIDREQEQCQTFLVWQYLLKTRSHSLLFYNTVNNFIALCLSSVQCPVFSVQCAVCSVQCAVSSVQCPTGWSTFVGVEYIIYAFIQLLLHFDEITYYKIRMTARWKQRIVELKEKS